MANPDASIRDVSINKTDLYKSFIPSLIVLIISIFFGYLFQIVIGIFGLNQNNPNFDAALKVSNNLWFYPVLAYGAFIWSISWLRKKLDEKIIDGRSSRKELSKTIAKWSGVVDGIGTALPLIGAAVILFTVGLGRESENLFLEFAVPFEIKSLFILAIAKLFEFAFDELEIQYLGKVYEDTGDEKEQVMKNMKIELLNLPDKETLNEINSVLANWNEAVHGMKDPKFEKNLENIIKITGR